MAFFNGLMKCVKRWILWYSMACSMSLSSGIFSLPWKHLSGFSLCKHFLHLVPVASLKFDMSPSWEPWICCLPAWELLELCWRFVTLTWIKTTEQADFKFQKTSSMLQACSMLILFRPILGIPLLSTLFFFHHLVHICDSVYLFDTLKIPVHSS